MTALLSMPCFVRTAKGTRLPYNQQASILGLIAMAVISADLLVVLLFPAPFPPSDLPLWVFTKTASLLFLDSQTVPERHSVVITLDCLLERGNVALSGLQMSVGLVLRL
jgi:hypothetical protein